MTHSLKDRNLLAIFIFVVSAALLMPVISIFVIQPMYLDLLVKGVEEEAVRTTTHVSHMLLSVSDDGPILLGQPEEKEALKSLTHDMRIHHIKVFNPSGQVIFSGKSHEIGRFNRHDYFHTIVAAGKTYSKIVRKDELTSDGDRVVSDVVETYVPVMKDGYFLGAVELYYDFTGSNQKLRSVQIISNSLALALSLLLISIFVLFMIRLDRSVRNRELVERKLFESERRFREISEDSEEWIWEVDRQGIYTFTSPVCEKLFGMKPDDMVGKKHFYDLFLAEEREQRKNRIFALFERREIVREMVCKVAGSGGEIVWLSMSGRPIMDNDLELIGYRGVCKDITATVRYEEELLRDKLEFEALATNLANANKAIEANRNNLLEAFDRVSSLIQEVSSTQNVKIRYDNSRLKKCYEIKRCKKEQCPCYGKEATRCWQVAGTYCGNRVQGEFASKYGNCRECEVFQNDPENITDIIGEHFNNMMHMLQMSHDNLKDSEERFRAISETSSDAIVSIDGVGLITFWNNSASEVFGYEADEVMGRPVEMLIPERYREAYRNGLRRYPETRFSRLVDGKPVEVTGLCRDGREIPLELSLASWKKGGETFFTGIARDITQRKQIHYTGTP